MEWHRRSILNPDACFYTCQKGVFVQNYLCEDGKYKKVRYWAVIENDEALVVKNIRTLKEAKALAELYLANMEVENERP